MSKDRFLAELEEFHQRREAGQVAITAALAQLDRNNPGCSLIGFFSEGLGRVAILAVDWQAEKWTVTRFMFDGPTGHFRVKANDPTHIESELFSEGFVPIPDPTALEQVERWSQGPEWSKGLKQLMFTAIWNTFSYHKRPDLYRLLTQEADLDRAVALGQLLLKQELPNINIW